MDLILHLPRFPKVFCSNTLASVFNCSFYQWFLIFLQMLSVLFDQGMSHVVYSIMCLPGVFMFWWNTLAGVFTSVCNYVFHQGFIGCLLKFASFSSF